MKKVRLQKYMARAGIASRRSSEEIIAEGRVEVNGKVITEMGYKIDPAQDTVRVDGEELSREKFRYFKLNKPVGVVSTARDPEGRKTVVDYVRHIPQRLYPVGRLDYDSRGLILLTNDGELANILTHPSYEISKTYRVTIRGYLSSEALNRLETGLELEDGPTAPARLSRVEFSENQTSFLLTLHEGRNRQVRRMCSMTGYEVIDLKRIKIGPLQLQNLPEGEVRELTPEEQRALQDLKDQTKKQAKQQAKQEIRKQSQQQNKQEQD